MRFNALAQYSPMQTIQAARMGREERERDERKNAFAQAGEAYMGGDYTGAANALMPYDMGAGLQMAQYGQQQAQTAETEQLRKMYEVTQLLAKEPDVMRRVEMAQQMSPGLGIPAPTDPSDYTDDVLQRELDEMRIKGEFEEAGPEYGFMNVDGVLHRTNKTDGTSAALTERYIEPERPVAQHRILSPDEEVEMFGSDLPGSYQVESGTNKVSQVQGTAPRGPLVENTIGGNEEPTVFDEKVDAAAADSYVEWTQGGGADAVKQLSQVSQVLETLDSGENITGPLLGLVPQEMRALFNQGSVDAQQLIEEVVQRNLRLILGAQFAQREGELLIARAYNPQLDEKINKRRVARLFRQMETAARQKQAQMDYLEQNRTLRGYQGATPAMADFFAALDDADGGLNSPNWTPDQERRLQELEAKQAAGQIN